MVSHEYRLALAFSIVYSSYLELLWRYRDQAVAKVACQYYSAQLRARFISITLKPRAMELRKE
jgi:hypothetical protein